MKTKQIIVLLVCMVQGMFLCYGGDIEMENPYPKEYGFIRIGTPINVDTNELLWRNVEGFDMAALEAFGYLKKDDAIESRMIVHGNGYSLQDQQADSYAQSVTGGFSIGIVSVCVENHMNQSRNVCSIANSQNITAKAEYTNRGDNKFPTLMLKESISNKDRLFSCATAEFQKAYSAISDTSLKTDTDRMVAIQNFYKDFGTGFVSGVKLAAIGIFKGKANYEGTSSDFNLNIGGSLEVNVFTPKGSGGGKFANEWCKKAFTSERKGSFVCASFSCPAGNPCEAMVKPIADKFNDMQISRMPGEMSQDFSKSFDAKMPSPGKWEIPPRVPPFAGLPNFQFKNFKDISKMMRYQDWRKDHPRGSWEEYNEELERVARSSPVAHPPAPSTHLQGNDIRGANYMEDPLEYFANISKQQELSSDLSDNLDISSQEKIQANSSAAPWEGYYVIGYTYSSWSDYFPELNFAKIISSNNIGLGKVQQFWTERCMIGQYLRYCQQYSTFTPKGFNDYVDVYFRHLKIFKDDVKEVGLITVEKFVKIRDEFEEKLRNDGNFVNFMPHYNYIKDNFYWLKQGPLGFIPVTKFGSGILEGECSDGGVAYYTYLKSPDYPNLKPFSGDLAKMGIVDMIRAGEDSNGAICFKPIIATLEDGRPGFIWVSVALLDDTNKKIYVLTGQTIKELREGEGLESRVREPRNIHIRYTPRDESGNLRLCYSKPFGKDPEAEIKGSREKDNDNNDTVIPVLNYNEKEKGDNRIGVYLIPVGYDKIANIPVSLKYGGIPMWPDLGLDKIEEGLRNSIPKKE